MLAISIVLFVVPDNSYLVMFQHYFTCRVSLFRNQNLNILKKTLPKTVSFDFLHPIPLKHSYPLTFQLKSLKVVYASIHLP